MSEARFVEAFRGLLMDLGEEDLLRLTEGIFMVPSASAVFLHLCQGGASTTFVLIQELWLPEASIYRAVKRLRSLNLIESALRVSDPGSRGGPRPVVWALKDASTEDVARAARRHRYLYRE